MLMEYCRGEVPPLASINMEPSLTPPQDDGEIVVELIINGAGDEMSTELVREQPLVSETMILYVLSGRLLKVLEP